MNKPIMTANYSYKKETPGFWVYEMGRPGVGQLYIPKALVPKQPAEQLKADFFKVK
jgi:hypothetical protein